MWVSQRSLLFVAWCMFLFVFLSNVWLREEKSGVLQLAWIEWSLCLPLACFTSSTWPVTETKIACPGIHGWIGVNGRFMEGDCHREAILQHRIMCVCYFWGEEWISRPIPSYLQCSSWQGPEAAQRAVGARGQCCHVSSFEEGAVQVTPLRTATKLLP